MVTKRITINYNSILKAKIYFFFKRSMWRYLLAMLIVAYVFPLNPPGFLLSALIYFLAFIIVILVPLYHFSSVRLAKKTDFDAEVTFSKANIVIAYKNRQSTEIKEWTWIRNIDITSNNVWLVTNEAPRFLISLGKNKLSESEWLFFEEIKREKFHAKGQRSREAKKF